MEKIKVLFITNKHVTGKEEQKFYPYFLKNIVDNCKSIDIDLKYVFFSDLFKDSVLTQNDYWYCDNNTNSISSREVDEEAHKIEKDYLFTFMNAYYSEALQASDYSRKNNHRNIHLPEKAFTNLNSLIDRFNYLKKIIMDENISVVISDQSTDAEIEFSRAICLKHQKIFFRLLGGFLERRLFDRYYQFGKEKIIEAVFDKDFSVDFAKKFISDYINNKKLPYPQPVLFTEKLNLWEKIYKKLTNKKYWQVPLEILKFLIKKLNNIFFDLYINIEKIAKRLLEYNFNPNVSYIFWPLHLQTEAAMAVYGFPYINQMSLIESVSRVMPYGTYLYIREHPYHKDKFSYKLMHKLSKLPNVRIISANVSIHDILKNTIGIITYNATTGIEALMYGKPVLSFSPNVYYKHHPAVDYCSDPYELGTKLSKLINTKVKHEDTIKYIQKMFQISNDIPMEADSFLSIEDAKEKAEKFVDHVKAAIDICFEETNNV